MPIISSVPALNLITKGSPATFTLDKTALALVASVAASPYYSVQTNWRAVQLNYQGVGSTQSESVIFDASLASPTSVFDIVTQGVDIFNIESISIIDFQNGYFIIPRSELTVVDFDVDMSAAPSPSLYARDFVTLNSFQPYESVSGSGGSYSVVTEGLRFIRSVSGYFTYLNSDFIGASLPTSTYKLRVYIHSFTGDGNLDVGLMNSGTVAPPSVTNNISNSVLLANVGGYVDVDIVGIAQTVYLIALTFYSTVSSDIVISKTEILSYP